MKTMAMLKGHFKRSVVIAVFLVVVITAVFFIEHFSSGSANGTILPVKKPASDPTSEHYSDQYIAFNYPTYYQLVSSGNSGSYLDVINLNNNNYSNRFLTIGISTGSYANAAGVVYRQSHPAIYKQTTTANYLLFTGYNNGSEYTAFLEHDGLIASVSFTSPNSTTDFSGDFKTVITSWRWQ